MATTATTTEARASLPDLLDRVAAGEEITITRHGRPVAVLVQPDALRARRADGAMAQAERVRATLAAGRGIALSDAPGLTEERAEELIAAVRVDRRRR